MAFRNPKVPVLEVEITTKCNWACEFCPVSIDPKKDASMSLELFEEICRKGVEHGCVGICPNSYNEPTIDPLFMDRIEIMAKHGLKLYLYTNGSGLTQAKVDRLKELGIVAEITFNIPSLDQKTFETMTGGYKHLDKTRAAHKRAIDAGFRVLMSVNGLVGEIRKSLPVIQAAYPGNTPQAHYNLETPLTSTGDRAGKLENRYGQWFGVTLERLAGCEVTNSWLAINVHGDFFLCCEDYDQKTIYGNIRDGSIMDIITSDKAKALYDQVDGDAVASKDLICRKCFVMAQNIYNRTMIMRPKP